MAQSVELKWEGNSNINLEPNNELLINTSELEKKQNDCDRLSIMKTKEEEGEKVKIYRADKTFNSRREEAAAIRKKFPSKIPIIVGRFHKESSLPRLERSKFLVPQEITMSQFVTIIRNRMKLGSNQAFYLLVNNRSMLSLSKTLGEVYKDHKEKDGFLYMTYASQEVFGCR